ncbi:flavodoxin domain-containing protein [Roseomonas gilardii subsp. gilardii]|uniref:flavodoxin domain-containing protein n=1 Tax=Roseomonas gilardii TaxID=257708 RepID=UPI001FFC29D8|nr:flavodoxin domain-containing protein [Roseomonas gilardii]UPG73198.1 flavodoxin domain-containing protein [Roseomonas gilardii subsp. gilardii]
MKLLILVGTMTGTAEMVADELAAALDGAEIVAMDGGDPAVLKDAEACILCTSTYGDGEVPDGAKPFYDALRASTLDLSGLRYGVIALGDSSYETFCEGGRLFDKALASLGAHRVGEILCCDANSGDMPEEKAGEWLEGWRDALAAEAGAAA